MTLREQILAILAAHVDPDDLDDATNEILNVIVDHRLAQLTRGR